MNTDDNSPALPKQVTGSPAEIWLVYGDLDREDTHANCYRDGDVNWCEDPQFDTDVRYVRADISEAAHARPVSEARWYSLSHTGIANVCASEWDAQQASEVSQITDPRHGPYRAVQLVEASELDRMRADRDLEKRLRKNSDDLATDLRLALESVMSRKGDTGLAWDVLQRIHGAHWSPA